MRVDPQLAGGAATITLPAGGIVVVAAEHGRAVAPDIERKHVAEAERSRRAAGAAHAKAFGVPEKRRATVACEQDVLAVGRPPHDAAGLCAHEREAFRGSAVRRHDVNFGVPLFPADEGDESSVARQAWARAFAQPGGQAPRDAAGGRHRPKIIFTDKYDDIPR